MVEEKEKLIEDLFEKGVLVNKDLLAKKLEGSLIEKIEAEEDLIVLNSDYARLIKQESSLVDWYEFDSYRVEAEKDRNEELYHHHLQGLIETKLLLTRPSEKGEEQGASFEADLKRAAPGTEINVSLTPLEEETVHSISEDNLPVVLQTSTTVIISYKNDPKKYHIKDFTNFFLSRYKFLESILRNRQELSNTLTINRVLNKKERGQVSVIGLVSDVAETKNGNLIITLEDPTGHIKILISKNKKDLFKEGKDLVVDEVVGVSGATGEKIVFAESIAWPDLPQNNELKKGEEEEYILFLSDIHVGSTLFLKKEFEKFLSWINGLVGTEEQQEIARKVKYIFIAGDLVDGVGIYPSQESELELNDIKDQYAEFCRLIKKIPLDKELIICPGNHDSVHLAEPQPVFDKEFAAGLFELPNVKLVTNPSLVNVGKTESFSGHNILMYHGYSFDYYVANVESIRSAGGYLRSDLIMKFLLKRRHLAPSFKSTPYYPSHKEDPLLIKQIPDFLITGHIHYSCVANYKGVTMISGSCWQGKTSFQEKLGHEPEPARVPVVSLKTREVKVLRFG
jgi:DNA polymerase II small subunit